MLFALFSFALCAAGIDDSMFASPEKGSSRENKMTARSLAREYLSQSKPTDERSQWREDVIFALTNLAQIIDQSATRYEVEYGTGDELQRVLATIDQKGREMKKKVQALEAEATAMKAQIDEIVNKTNEEVAKYMKQVRKDVVRELRAMVQGALGDQRVDAEQLKDRAKDTIGAMNKSSSFISFVYFAGFQVLLALCLYLTWRYLKVAI